MRGIWLITASIVVMAMGLPLAVAAAPAAPAEALATSDELRQLFKDKQYQPLLQKLQRVLLLKGDAAKPYDRCELLMLKGETHLQLKEQSLAATSYAEAVKAIDAQTDAKEAASAQATVLLVKRAHAYACT